MMIPFMRHVAWYLVIAMFIIGIAPGVDAGLAKSETILLAHIDRTADLEKIQKFLEIKAISKRLEQLGLTQDEIQKRLNQLSDLQIHQIALQLDDLKIGKDDVLGVVIALLVIAILVVLLLQLTGHKVIVTK
ncbi:MAG: PA2779 family protein [Nitrospirota bacterium]